MGLISAFKLVMFKNVVPGDTVAFYSNSGITLRGDGTQPPVVIDPMSLHEEDFELTQRPYHDGVSRNVFIGAVIAKLQNGHPVTFIKKKKSSAKDMLLIVKVSISPAWWHDPVHKCPGDTIIVSFPEDSYIRVLR